MKNRLHELDLGTGGEDWNQPNTGGGDNWNQPETGDRERRRTVDLSPLVKEVPINKIMLQINKLVEKQDKEAEVKRKEEERIAAIKPVDSVISGGDL